MDRSCLAIWDSINGFLCSCVSLVGVVGWWMVLGKLSVPGRRATLDNGPYVDLSAIQA